MTRFLFAAATIAGALAVHAQNPTVAGDVKQTYTSAKNNLLKAAGKMPEADYGFKPSPDIRSFGELLAHIADSQVRYCSLAQGGPMKSGSAASKTSKADIVAALKASFDDCDAVYDAMTDTTGAEVVKLGQRQMTKLGILVRNAVHDNEEYGYLAVYMRLKGVVPPSSERP